MGTTTNFATIAFSVIAQETLSTTTTSTVVETITSTATITTTATTEVDVTVTSVLTVTSQVDTTLTATSTTGVTSTVSSVATATFAVATNVVANGGFEDGVLSPWTSFYYYIGTSSPHSGTYAAQSLVAILSTIPYIQQTLTTTTTSTYSCNFAWNSPQFNPWTTLTVYVDNKSVSTYTVTANNYNMWNTASFSFTGKGSNTIKFAVSNTSMNPGFVNLDDITCMAQ